MSPESAQTCVSLPSRSEFLGVAYDPDVLDPVVGDLERKHGHGDAVLLGDQAGLAVDRASRSVMLLGIRLAISTQASTI